MPRSASRGPSFPYAARLTDGRTVRVTPIDRQDGGTAGRQDGRDHLREVRSLITGLMDLGPTATETFGLSLPTAWAAGDPDRPGEGDLGIAWWTPIPYHRITAVAEVALAPGMAGTGLGRMLLDLLVLSAAERGVEWLQVRIPAAEEPRLAPVAKSLGGRVTDREGDVCFVEIPLAQGRRRFLRSGVHAPIRPSDRLSA